MDEFLQQVVDNMRKNEFEVVELHTAQEACDYLNDHIDAGKTVGVAARQRARHRHSGKTAGEGLHRLFALGRAKGRSQPHPPQGHRRGRVPLLRQRPLPVRASWCSSTARATGRRRCASAPEQVYFVISHSKVVDGGINTAIARIKKTACPPNARPSGAGHRLRPHRRMRPGLPRQHVPPDTGGGPRPPGTEDHRAVRGGNAGVLIRAIGLPFSCSFREKTEKPR